MSTSAPPVVVCGTYFALLATLVVVGAPSDDGGEYIVHP